MTQQINLINTALIKKKDFLTFVNIGLVYGVFCLLVIAWFGYANHEVSGLSKQREAVIAELTQTQERLLQMAEMVKPQVQDAYLKAQVAQLEEDKELHAHILKVISQDKAQTTSLAGYMRGLARQTMDGLWLTGFSIDHKRKAMTLSGRSLSADILPQYMKKLGKDPVFLGQSFGGLHVKLPVAAIGTMAESAETNAETTVVPHFVEFELQGLETGDGQSVEHNALVGMKS